MTSSTANHDPQEIARFDAIAQRWWDPHGEFRPLHEINPLRLEWIERSAGLAGKQVMRQSVFDDLSAAGGHSAMADAAAQHVSRLLTYAVGISGLAFIVAVIALVVAAMR